MALALNMMTRSLPYRQLRNYGHLLALSLRGSLPYRQLRKKQPKASRVHCRIGSLETLAILFLRLDLVHSRIGSLEKALTRQHKPGLVHCRTGSLEIFHPLVDGVECVHCRTGSLGSLPPDYVYLDIGNVA